METSSSVMLRPINPENLIAQAIEKGVPVETMERLLAMRRELKAEAAKESYDRALAAFQAECPAIEKTKKVFVKGALRYSYAPLESIIKQVQKLLERHGFSYCLDAAVEPGWVTATCELTHAQGHAKKSSLKVPIQSDAFMGEAQKVASALTFAKRYAFVNSLGIMTSDEDDDSRGAEENHPHTERQKPAGRATPPSTPTPFAKAAPSPAAAPAKATASDVLPKPATEATRKWMLEYLRKALPEAVVLGYAREAAIILPDVEGLESWPLHHVPTDPKGLQELFNKISEWQKKNEPPAETGEDPAYFDVILTIPRKGMKRDEYLKNPDTIGSLYHAMKDGDKDAQSRLWGFAHNFEVQTSWEDRDGKQHLRKDGEIAADKKLRAALDEFMAEHGHEGQSE